MPQRFWIVSEQYYPQETATGYLLTELAEGLADYLDVRVVCGMPAPAADGASAPRREQRHGVSIRRCTATHLNKDVLWQRLVNLATSSVSLFVEAVRQIGRGDYVLVVTNPPLLPFFVSLACRLCGARCILLIYDIYPEVMVATGLVRQNAPLARWLGWLNQRLYRSVEWIVVLGRDMARRVQTKLEPGDRRVVIIPNWAEPHQVVPADPRRNALLRELDLTDKFVVQYAGNMGRPNDLESLIESARLLRDEDGIHFLFIGSGAKRAWLECAVREHHLANVTILPHRPRSDQQNFINACDVGVVSLVPGMTGVAVPSRMYNILAAGKPLLAIVGEDSEAACVVREEQVGWVAPPGQPDRIVQAILAAQAHPQRLSEMGARARSAAETKYSLDRVLEGYLALVAEVRADGSCGAQRDSSLRSE
jgi:colanic acid biosynthesis glycosyl transferase WcaI